MRLAGLLDLLRERPRGAPPVLDVPFAPALPVEDDPADLPGAELTSGSPVDDPLAAAAAEGQTFAICYVAADGRESTRRITVWALKRNSAGNAVLYARCAERNATRCFRIDRIRYCIDMNGEVFEPPSAFLAETFGLPEGVEDFHGNVAPAPKSRVKSAWSTLRNEMLDELVVLAAMSESDGYVAFPEAAAIVDYADQRAAALDIRLEEADRKKLAGYIRRIRPGDDQIRRAVENIERLPVQAQIGLVAACQEVMFADGEVHEAEEALLASIRADLFGLN